MSLPAWDRLLLTENLYWAWRKAQFLYARTEGMHDEREVAAFELDLEHNLNVIQREFASRSYRLTPLRLLPQPKSAEGEMRQSFQVSVRDQVAWIALINAIGPGLDLRMVPWSYGHRLYRSAWIEELADGEHRTHLGPFRHTSAQLFRKFRQSWPLYKRHIILTARKLGSGHIKEDELDEGERRVYRDETDPNNRKRKLPYLAQDYFTGAHTGEVHFGSIDLTQFYPRVGTSVLLRALNNESKEIKADARLQELVTALLRFRVDTTGLTDHVRKSATPQTPRGAFNGIPTGLMVAGFLANVALMNVDRIASADAAEFKVAHFRFVDDHTFLAPTFDKLVAWFERYLEILKAELPSIKINEKKTQPDEFRVYMALRRKRPAASTRALSRKETDARAATKVDPSYPRPLLTRTLTQLSLLQHTDFDLLDDEGQQGHIEHIVDLMLTGLPDAELRADTRHAYAASRLTSLIPRWRENIDAVTSAARDLKEVENELTKRRGLRNASDELLLKQRELSRELDNALSALKSSRDRRHRRTFQLLLDAFKQHPHKGRLLQQCLTLCALTGFPGVQVTLREIDKRTEASDAKGLSEYLHASALHVLADLCVRSVRRTIDVRTQTRLREASLTFLQEVASLSPTDFRPSANFFWSDAVRTLQISLLTSASLLREGSPLIPAGTHSLSQRLDLLAAGFTAASAEPGNLFHSVAREHTPAWLHWSESRTRGYSETEPTALWSATSRVLDPLERLGWASLRRYPRHLPANVYEEIRAGKVRLEQLDEGWAYDALRFGSPLKGSTTRALRRAERVLTARPGTLDLVRWAEATEALHRWRPFDPRCSEWTCLEILRQVLNAIEAFDPKLPTQVWHPTNFLVPSTWIAEVTNENVTKPSSGWSWESWRNLCQHGRQISRRPADEHIADYRYVSNTSSPEDRVRAEMISYGLILFGLLRRSFEWPSVWNLRGQHRSHVQLASSESHALPVSSRTLAILDGLLRPRSWESILLYSTAPGFTGLDGDEFSAQVEVDTKNEVPPLSSLREVRKAIAVAQSELQQAQTAGLGREPRQLIPVRLTTLAALPLAGPDANPDEDAI
jgi:hypothetical protein